MNDAYSEGVSDALCLILLTALAIVILFEIENARAKINRNFRALTARLDAIETNETDEPSERPSIDSKQPASGSTTSR